MAQQVFDFVSGGGRLGRLRAGEPAACWRGAACCCCWRPGRADDDRFIHMPATCSAGARHRARRGPTKDEPQPRRPAGGRCSCRRVARWAGAVRSTPWSTSAATPADYDGWQAQRLREAGAGTTCCPGSASAESNSRFACRHCTALTGPLQVSDTRLPPSAEPGVRDARAAGGLCLQRRFQRRRTGWRGLLPDHHASRARRASTAATVPRGRAGRPEAHAWSPARTCCGC